MASVLIIDDETGVRESMSLILKMEGFSVDTASNGSDALQTTKLGKYFDFILCDIRMPGMDGIGFLTEFKKSGTDSIVIMISAFGTVEDSINAIKYGASDYITKPVNTDELLLRMRMAQERQVLEKENVVLRKELRKEFGFEDIVYRDNKIAQVIETARKVSGYKTTVLITGESGTGKELFARAIHNNSSRKDKPFVALNCAAIPENLLESELFGYEEGAFSGAVTSKPGLFEEASGGTLLLDEIGEIPLSLQPKLLRVLQEGELRRLGSNKTIKLDVRIIAATSSNLANLVEDNEFRDDLFYRLNVLPINIPPLRERKDDIPMLADYFIEKYKDKLGTNVTSISSDAMSKLIEYPWHGNVRELENIIERAMILTDGDIIEDLEFLNEDVQSDPSSWFDSLKLDEALKRLEKLYIERALNETNGNRTHASRILGISRRGLLYKIKEHKLANDDISEDDTNS